MPGYRLLEPLISWKQFVLRKKPINQWDCLRPYLFLDLCLLDLELILKQCLTFECLLKQPCLILLWHHQNLVFIHSQWYVMTLFLTKWYFFLLSTSYVVLTFVFSFIHIFFGFMVLKGGKDMINLCIYLYAMIWDNASNMFVKHDVE